MKIIENFDVKGCLPCQAATFPTCASGIENIFDGEFPQRITYHSKKNETSFFDPFEDGLVFLYYRKHWVQVC